MKKSCIIFLIMLSLAVIGCGNKKNDNELYIFYTSEGLDYCTCSINTFLDNYREKYVEVEVPSESNDGKKVTEIAAEGFIACIYLKKIVIPEGVVSIGSSAFNGCSALTDIELPSTLESIGQDAFIGCDSLSRIKIPENVNFIAEYAFWHSGLKTVYLKKDSYADEWFKENQENIPSVEIEYYE